MSRPEVGPAHSTRSRPGRVVMLLAAAVLGLALLAAWLVPPLAILAIWPLLFVVPGWAALRAVGPRIATAGRLGLSIVLSVAISAHLVYWISLLIGYGRQSVFVAAALLAVASAALALRSGGIRSVRFGSMAAAGRSLLRAPGPFVVAALAFGLVGAVLASGLWHVTATGVDSGGSNWSDLGVHLSIAQTVNAGNFPPQVPFFAGVPLTYHWFADFHAAVAAEAAGVFVIPVFALSSATFAAALALIVFELGRLLLRGRRPGKHVRRAALIGAGLAIFAGGFGWIRFVGDLVSGYGDPLTLVSHNSYDNAWFDAIGKPVAWPYFRIPSVLGTGLLVHRATAAGLPMLAGVVLLLAAGLPTAGRRRTGWHDRPWLIGLAGTLGALLAPFHFFFFPASLLLGFLWALFGGRLWDRATARNAGCFLAPYLLSLPFVVTPLQQATGSGALHLVAGWESAPFSDGPAAVAFFYATNLGLPLLLAIAALLVPRTPARWFLGAWAVTLFVVPNVVQVSAIAFDMNKYFQVMAVALALLAGSLVRRWPLPAVAVVFAVAIPSPLLVSAWTAINREQVLNADQLAAAQWIAADTPQGAIFATDGWLNAPTDLAGRLRLTTFTPYVANLGYDPDERTRQLGEIYCGGDAARSAALMRRLGATYLIDGSRPSPCSLPVDFATAAGFERVYHNPSLTIYRLGAPVSSAP